MTFECGAEWQNLGRKYNIVSVESSVPYFRSHRRINKKKKKKNLAPRRETQLAGKVTFERSGIKSDEFPSDALTLSVTFNERSDFWILCFVM